ncbi:MAG: hypothetical protein KC464_14980 [Myxococcales bacterium]|nr:hypothetical protein [Myxococcales bacterium]
MGAEDVDDIDPAGATEQQAHAAAYTVTDRRGLVAGCAAMAIDSLVIIALAVTAATHAVVRNRRERARRARRLRRLPRVAIADFVEGQAARIVGRVIELETFPAPLSRRPCVAAEAIAVSVSLAGIAERAVGKSASLVRDLRMVRFLVDDGTGIALVEPEGAEAVLSARRVLRRDPEGWGRRLLVRCGARAGDGFRYHEGAIVPGATVAVGGHGVRETAAELEERAEDDDLALDAERDRGAAGAARAAAPTRPGAPGGYRDGPALRLTMRSSERAPLLVGDLRAALR